MNVEKKSISQLEGWSWNIETPDKTNSSYEEYNFYLLHNKPLGEYTVADIYFMIGQESGLKYMIPLAIARLANDILLEAEDYPGDLLSRTLRIPENYWHSFPEYYLQVLKLIRINEDRITHFQSTREIEKQFKKALESFLNFK